MHIVYSEYYIVVAGNSRVTVEDPDSSSGCLIVYDGAPW